LLYGINISSYGDIRLKKCIKSIREKETHILENKTLKDE
jgi:hypothetical protein